MASYFPRRRPKDIPARFIETNVALSRDFEYVESLRTFMSGSDAREHEQKIKTLWDDTRQQKDALFGAMKEFQNNLAKKDPSIIAIDLKTCSWPDVMREFNRAQQYHKEKTWSRYKPISQYLRAFGAKAQFLGQWVELLPAGDYGAGLCGALKLILGAASRLHDIRTFVYMALSEIPDAVEKARRYMNIYKNTSAFQLTQRTIELYSAILVALKDIMDYFLDRPARKIFSSMIFGSGYKASLEESVKKIKDCVSRLDDEANMCNQERNDTMATNIRYIMQNSEAVGRERYTHQITDGAADLRRLKITEEDFGQAQYRKIEKDLISNILNTCKELLSANPRIDHCTGLPREEVKKTNHANRPRRHRHTPKIESLSVTEDIKPKGVPSEEMIALLIYRPDHIIQDLEECCIFGEMMGEEEKEQASRATRSDQLRKFLTESSQSRALLINGNFDDPNPTSSLSFLLAKISLTYSDAKDVIVLSYFCSLHADVFDPRANAIGMMISLVGQLLSYPGLDFDLTFMDEELCNLIERDDCKALCTVFLHLIAQLARLKLVFCFIDSISIYETDTRVEDTELVLSTLTNLVSQDGGAIFNLLVTDPGRSLCASRYITEDEEVLEMDDSIDDDGHGILDLEGLSGGQ
ncbi:MAG: hypothetical protein Q9187_003655 [Circinaria calcarea]